MIITRLAALAALVASAALLGPTAGEGPPLCGFDSGCAELVTSRFGRVLGVPLAWLGLPVFAAVFVASLFPAPPVRRWLCRLAVAVGLAALTLLGIQLFVLGRLCPYCLVVDVAAVVVAVAQVAGARGQPPVPDGRTRFLWAGTAALVLVPALALGPGGGWAAWQGQDDVPPQVRALWVPGKVTLVEAIDFDCPVCRQLDAVLARLLREEVGNKRLRVVRIATPRPAHTRGRDAARAFLCASAQGRGDELAEDLFAAGDRSPAGWARLARRRGLAMPRYRACVAAPETDRRLDADAAWVRSASPRGVPVLWVQGEKFHGFQPLETLRAAVRAAEQHPDPPAGD